MTLRGHKAVARACANIALVKYWGKRDAALNLPAAGSLSLTLDSLITETSVSFLPGLARDQLVLDAHPAPETSRQRMSRWLDLVRARAGIAMCAEVVSHNAFPTASGLASSASAYAALAVAASAAAGLDLDPRELSVLARRGSGSAARSICGGFAVMHPGERDDGSDAFAEPILLEGEWPVRIVVAVVAGGPPKRDSSRDAMEHCARTSPLYRAWVDSVPDDLRAARAAISSQDLCALGEVAEASALAMHAAAMASRPAVLYWRPETIACMKALRELREQGTPAYFTIDAGPHVKALTLAAHADRVAAALRGVGGVSDVLVCAPGGPAELIGSSED